jgi:MFS family permease
MTNSPTSATASVPLWRTATTVMIAGCLVALIGFGVRSSFGLFLDPMTVTKGWDRSTFSMAMAIQNLLWGAGVPIAGMLADRFGPSRVLAVGAVLYALGAASMGWVDGAVPLYLFGGVLGGLGIAFTAFSLALAAMARVVGPERRSLALGLGTAAGSAGQVVYSPLTQAMISTIGWYDALMIISLSTLLIIPLAFLLPGPGKAGTMQEAEQTMGDALKQALGNQSYLLLTAGFFVCGFQVAFITVHYPAYVRDIGLPAYIGAAALALVGFFNIAGSLAAGYFGQHYSKKWGLSFIYFGRSVATFLLLMAPKTETTILLYAAAMGLLWLSTVPLTSGLVAQMFGVRYMATLFGIVFFSHQIGSFLGVWLGGYFYDTLGTYDPVWWLNIAFGIFAGIVHMPINERPIKEQLAARAAQ